VRGGNKFSQNTGHGGLTPVSRALSARPCGFQDTAETLHLAHHLTAIVAGLCLSASACLYDTSMLVSMIHPWATVRGISLPVKKFRSDL
jgi:hypothetical protein